MLRPQEHLPLIITSDIVLISLFSIWQLPLCSWQQMSDEAQSCADLVPASCLKEGGTMARSGSQLLHCSLHHTSVPHHKEISGPTVMQLTNTSFSCNAVKLPTPGNIKCICPNSCTFWGIPPLTHTRARARVHTHTHTHTYFTGACTCRQTHIDTRITTCI